MSDSPQYNSLKPYSISKKIFLQLLHYLETHQFLTTTFASIQNKCASSTQQGRQVILTFDDCSKSLLDYAIVQLEKRNMKAVFFMPTAYIGKTNSWNVQEGKASIELMDDRDLQALVQLKCEVGSHGHNHIKLGLVKNAATLQYQLTESKKIIEGITGKPATAFCYPYGSVPVGYKNYLQQAGYTTGSSIYQPYESRYALRRFIYHDGDTDSTIGRKLSGVYKVYRRLIDPIRSYS